MTEPHIPKYFTMKTVITDQTENYENKFYKHNKYHYTHKDL